MEKKGDHSHGGKQTIGHEQGYLLPESEEIAVPHSGMVTERTKDLFVGRECWRISLPFKAPKIQ